MYIPLYQLSGYDSKEAARSQERWENTAFKGQQDLVFKLIRKGAGEDFLQYDYQEGILNNFLDNEQDLKGINVFNENIDFPIEDNFENIDFSYSSFYHSTFKNACFNCSFNFAKIYNCKFVNCIFHFAYWYGCTIENTTFENCDFVERHKFNNCDFINTKFPNYSISELLFNDCRFDSNTKMNTPRFTMITKKDRDTNFNKKQIADFYKSLFEGYRIGNVPYLYRKYKYLSQKNRTNYCAENWLDWANNKLLIEYLTGYGLRPIRPLIALIMTIAYFPFLYHVDNTLIITNGILKTVWQTYCNGFWFSINIFTNLKDVSRLIFPNNLLFIAESFLITIFLALFVTVLSNTWFTE